MNRSTRTKATQAVLTVGSARGFVVECEHRGHPMRIVITAAHCLPPPPPAQVQGAARAARAEADSGGGVSVC
jgi:hypothetical protein